MNDAETLPCGCVIGTDGVDTLIYVPCSMTCENWLFVQSEAEKQGKPVTISELG